uniref:Uncharacterized protein n=1 Tax=Ixodes scapularis TaxID=6945 RepID=A0A4D5RDM1_IXOSC
MFRLKMWRPRIYRPGRGPLQMSSLQSLQLHGVQGHPRVAHLQRIQTEEKRAQWSYNRSSCRGCGSTRRSRGTRVGRAR